MKLEIVTRSAPRKALIEAAATLFIKRLNLEKSKYTLIIYTITNLAKKDQLNGATFKIGPKEISIGLDSRLGMHQLTQTLAHEMVHVKQHAKGQLTQKVSKRTGKTTNFWLGQKCSKDYYNTPWEIEAYSRERILANEIFALIDKLNK